MTVKSQHYKIESILDYSTIQTKITDPSVNLDQEWRHASDSYCYHLEYNSPERSSMQTTLFKISAN